MQMSYFSPAILRPGKNGEALRRCEFGRRRFLSPSLRLSGAHGINVELPLLDGTGKGEGKSSNDMGLEEKGEVPGREREREGRKEKEAPPDFHLHGRRRRRLFVRKIRNKLPFLLPRFVLSSGASALFHLSGRM